MCDFVVVVVLFLIQFYRLFGMNKGIKHGRIAATSAGRCRNYNINLTAELYGCLVYDSGQQRKKVAYL